MLILCAVLVLALCIRAQQNYSFGDVRDCNRDGKENLIFEVLPGFGWDNLVNENRGVVVSFNYSKCKITEDRKYLIPDCVVTIPIKTSHVNFYSKVYDHWSQYESDTAFSVNAEGSAGIKGVNIAGSLSKEYEHVKKYQLDEKSFTTKVQARFVRYTAKLLTDAQLDRSFRNRLLKIAYHIQNNRTLSTKYESELLVRDYGTHVLTSVDAGASIVKVDQVDNTLLKDDNADKVQIGFAASLSLFGIASLNIKTQYSYSENTIDNYMKNVKNSEVRAYGGPPCSPENFSLSEWTTMIGNDLVAVDKNGLPLDYVISTTTLPELSQSLIEEIVQSVRSAIASYFLHNTYPGCTNPEAPNFSKISNLDDGTCHANFKNLAFGGVYQECSFSGRLINYENLCDSLTTKNPQTQDFTCPDNFEEVPLFEGRVDKSQFEHICKTCWFFSTCCVDKDYYGVARYKSYWCRARPNLPAQKNNMFLFGGLYSDKTSNFVTQTKSCPQFYNPVTIAANIQVCISSDSELAKITIPFGGFYSCQYGNPLVNGSYTQSCPVGFSSYLATIDNKCGIYYCIWTGRLPSEIKFPTVQLPPFSKIPAESLVQQAHYVISNNAETWIQLIDPKTTNKNPPESAWMTLNSAPTEITALIKKFSYNYMVTLNDASQIPKSDLNDDSGMFKGIIVGVFVGMVTAICLAVGFYTVNRIQQNVNDSSD